MSGTDTGSKQGRPGLTLLFGAIAAVAASWGAYNQVRHNYLAREFDEARALAMEVDARLEGGSLVLFAPNGMLLQPDFLQIQPIFVDANSNIVAGEPIKLVVDSGARSADSASIEFEAIGDRVCEYPENFDFCQDGDISMLAFEVLFSIQGFPDVARVELGS